MDWPAYSSNLNPIEHVWVMFGRRIAARQPPPTSLPELRRAMLDEWCNIPQDQINNLILSMPRRCIINTTWLLYDRPAVTHMYPTREENVLICLGSDTASYLVGLIYPFVLIGFCTVYAFKTRKCPDGFNEARYLTFTNYTTCVIWLAFLPLFVLSTSNTIRSVTLSSLLSLSGAVQLACLFMPKVYIAVFKPEKNTKDAVMCPHNRNSSCLALPAAGLYQAPPSNLLNGGEDSYRWFGIHF
ncbi:metabotropic glutamate receptor 3 [Trichonephila clavipes]|nr:metabotropic glutamate receptor 3 [Trichonephila clavipes]